jgi:hypothetical protein
VWFCLNITTFPCCCKPCFCHDRGTAAHVVEPRLPGARDLYIDLGRFYDSARLEKRTNELKELSKRCSDSYASAYSLLSAAGRLKRESGDTPESDIVEATEACLSLLTDAKKAEGGSRHVFLNAFSANGRIFLSDTLHSLCSNVYGINASACDASRVLQRIAQGAELMGFGVIVCLSPLDPARILHLMLPGAGVAFTSDPGTAGRQLIRFGGCLRSDEHIELYEALMGAAEKTLANAKKTHDMLE